jgi:hypothetical protein
MADGAVEFTNSIMNPPARSQTRLKPAAAVSACGLAETMIITRLKTGLLL